MPILALIVLAVVALVAPAPLHAGDVLVAAKSGKLSIKGTGDPDVLTVAGVGQDTQVTPGAGTTVNGSAAPQSFTVTGKITVDLGAGDDALTFDGAPIAGDLNVKLGDGFDTFRLEDSNVDGKVAIDLGPGAGSVSLCSAATARGFSVKGGPSAPGVADAEAGCNGVDNSEATVANGTAIALGNFNTAGNLAVKLKTGDATVRMANSGAVGKGSFTFGEGTTFLGLCDAGFGGNVSIAMKNGTVSGPFQCTKPSAPPLSSIAPHAVILSGVDVGGSVTVKGGKDADVLTLDESAIGLKLKIALADGPGIVSTAASLVGTSLTVSTGKDGDIVTASTLTVGESAKVSVGAGFNIVTLGTAVFGENLTVKAGNDDDVIDTDETVVGGKKTIKPGGGTNTVQE